MSKELKVINQEGTLLIDSRDVAKMVEKRHDHVTRDIRSLLKRHPDFFEEFIEDTYIDSQNKKQPCYKITKQGYDILKNKYELGMLVAKLENTFKDLLFTIFHNEKIISQYSVLNYKIDFYFEELHIAVEYDENEHKYKRKEDSERQNNIIKYFKTQNIDVKFIRVQQGNEGVGIKEILNIISNKKDLNKMFILDEPNSGGILLKEYPDTIKPEKAEKSIKELEKSKNVMMIEN